MPPPTLNSSHSYTVYERLSSSTMRRKRMLATSWVLPCLFLSFFVSFISANLHGTSKCPVCLVLPPSIRWKLGPNEVLRLRQDCDRATSQGTVFAWEPDACSGYDICTRAFQAIANTNKRLCSKMTMWFPCIDATVIEGLAQILQQNNK